MKKYEDEAIRTLSDQYHGDLVPMRVLNGALRQLIEACTHLDKIKKSLFYGRSNGFAWRDTRASGMEPNCSAMASKRTRDLMHGIIGVATEAGELIEPLAAGRFDVVNMKEEVGDILWYLALIAKASGFTIEEAMETNIAKLRKRYPDAFTEQAANERDLDGERRTLEGTPPDTDEYPYYG